MVLSYFLMGARYNPMHIAGATVVLVGLLVVLVPEVWGSSHIGQCSSAEVALVLNICDDMILLDYPCTEKSPMYIQLVTNADGCNGPGISF